MHIGVADNTKPEGLSAFWRTKLEFVMILIIWSNDVKSNQMKFNKDKWLEKGKSNTQIHKYPVLALQFECDREMEERSEF